MQDSLLERLNITDVAIKIVEYVIRLDYENAYTSAVEIQSLLAIKLIEEEINAQIR